MISLTHEYTDTKGRHAQAWLFYDAECAFCTRIAQWLAVPLRKSGLDVAPLQDPRVGSLLALSRPELLSELRFLDADGSLHSGAKAFLALAREIAWARPLLWLSQIPGMDSAMAAAYRWIATQRNCHSLQCSAAEVSRR